jgi:hypothetical protein
MRLDGRRARLVGWCVFVVGATLCAYWAYASVAPSLPLLRQETGSGGVGAVSVGLVAPELLLLLSPVLTFVLTRHRISGAAGVRLRWMHVIATMVLIASAVIAASRGRFEVLVVIAAVFFPVQAFFVVAAIALRLSRAGMEITSGDGVR